MKCPCCSSPVQVVGRFAVCPEHGMVEPQIDGLEPWPAPCPVESLPFLIAAPLAEYSGAPVDRHPKLRLWDACETVEMLLRLIVMIGVADLRQGGGLRKELLRELRDRVERPTLGQWRGMAEAVLGEIDPDRATVPELARFMSESLIPFLDGAGDKSSPETSFVALRNHLAHGGGLTRGHAQKLLDGWHGPFEALMASVAFLGQTTLAVRQSDGVFAGLRGPSGRPEPLPAAFQGALSTQTEGSMFLVREGRVLVLWPMAIFGELLLPGGERIPGAQAPQVYTRTQAAGIQFTALATDWAYQTEGGDKAWSAFRTLFGLGRRPDDASAKCRVRGFEEEIQKDAREAIGRGAEIAELTKLMRERTEGQIWVGGQAGVGKSYTLAKAVALVLEDLPRGMRVLPFRFKAGDDRCSRDAFLVYALERLETWEGLAAGAGASTPAKPFDLLRERLGRIAGDHRIVFVLDGLDEIAISDPRFAAEVPAALDFPNLLWVCAGREEANLPATFRKAEAIEPWPKGLPRMTEGDIHEMLLEQLGRLRKRLIQGDRDEGERVVNGFVRRVAECAEGMPIYVRYVVSDVLGRRIAPEAASPLPPSLAAYHEVILERYGISDISMVLQPLVGTLAIALEALPLAVLTDLLSRHDESLRGPAGKVLVQQALSMIGAMLSRRPTPEGDEGYTLFHKSFRDHVLTSPRTGQIIKSARLSMARAALVPGPSASSPAASYLFRNGVTHLEEAGRVEQALGLLKDFPYLMARLQALQPGGAEGIGRDWRDLLQNGVDLDAEAQRWEAFFREREHLLCRGNGAWPSHKILLQLAVEHADDSPMTRQAEAWLEAGNCDWLWLRNVRRMAHAAPDPCIRVLEGHLLEVNGATGLEDGRILSWSKDGTLRLWSPEGVPLAVLEGHAAGVNGAAGLADGRILSWGEDGTLRFWSREGGTLEVLQGHTRGVKGVAVLAAGRILSWSEDETMRLWSQKGSPIGVLEGQTEGIQGGVEPADGRFLSLSGDGGLRLWSPEGVALAELKGHSSRIDGAAHLPGGGILSWSFDGILRIWSPDGAMRAVLEGHGRRVVNAAALADGRVLSWSSDGTLRLWSSEGMPLAVLAGHTDGILGAAELSGGRILSWARDRTLRAWSAGGEPLALLTGHSAKITGAAEVADGRIVSWSMDGTVRVWSSEGHPLCILKGHTRGITGAIERTGARILTWSLDGMLRLWSPQAERPDSAQGFTGEASEVALLADDRVLSWSNEGTLRIWSSEGAPAKVLAGHSGRIAEAIPLADGRILSWADDGTLRLWSPEGEALAVLEGHHDAVIGASALSSGRILSRSKGGGLRLWSAEGVPIAVLEGHCEAVTSVTELPDGRIVSGPEADGDGALRLWSPDGEALAVIEEPARYFTGATVLADGRILPWSIDGALRLWSPDGVPLEALEGHSNSIEGAVQWPDGRILSWSWDKSLRLWSPEGAPLAVLTGHTEVVLGAARLADGRILSYSSDGTLRLWSAEGAALALLEGHTCAVAGATELADGRIVSWALDGTLRLWSGDGTPAGSWLPSREPDPMVLARYRAEGRNRLGGDGAVVRCEGSGVSCLGAFWHTTSRADPRAILGDGTVVVRLLDGQLCFLKLQTGACRVDTAEATRSAHAGGYGAEWAAAGY